MNPERVMKPAQRQIDSRKHVFELKVPFHEMQPEEPDAAWRAFLIYRDLPLAKRNLLEVSRIYCEDPDLEEVPPALRKVSRLWSWDLRVESFLRSVQEEKADRAKGAILELKTEVEAFALTVAKKLRSLADCEDLEELEKHRATIAKAELLLGKGNAGIFMLQSYKTIVGAKVQVEGSIEHTVVPLTWKP